MERLRDSDHYYVAAVAGQLAQEHLDSKVQLPQTLVGLKDFSALILPPRLHVRQVLNKLHFRLQSHEMTVLPGACVCNPGCKGGQLMMFDV